MEMTRHCSMKIQEGIQEDGMQPSGIEAIDGTDVGDRRSGSWQL